MTPLLCGAVTSVVVTLVLGFAPSIVTGPAAELVWPDSNALFSVAVSGTGPFCYQWQLNGSNLADNIIETVAGDGYSGFYPDSGPATNAELAFPEGVAVDAAGNVYIPDSDNYRVQKVDLNGVISTLAGGLQHSDSGDGGPAADASLAGAFAVALDPSGNLYIGDQNRVRKVDGNGIITTVAGTGVEGFSGDGGLATNAKLGYVEAVACDSGGNLYIADPDNERIRKVNLGGIITTIAGDGTAGYYGYDIYATNAELSGPAGVAVDASGNLYIGDSGNNMIRKVAANGAITTIAGTGGQGFSGDGGLATAAWLYWPSGLALDASGNLYVADFGNNRIRKIGTNGVITTVAGESGYGFNGDGLAATTTALYEPSAVAFDTLGNLYIADSENARIREVFYAGQPALSLSCVNSANAGNYTVVISSAFGSVTSSVVPLALIVQPDINGIAVQADGSVALNFTGTPDASHCLWMTTNLSPPAVWSAIATNCTSTNGAGQLTDTNTEGAPARFYRVSLP
jgi:sugar lactone lactonase YvrE